MEFKGTKEIIINVTDKAIEKNLGYHTLENKQGRLIALVYCDADSSSEQWAEDEANLRLFQASPDLLEACQSALKIVDLWAPNYSKDNITESEIGELAALSIMRQYFEKSIDKALK